MEGGGGEVKEALRKGEGGERGRVKEALRRGENYRREERGTRQ